MAFEKTYVLPTEEEANYHAVTNVKVDMVSGYVVADIHGFKNEDAKKRGAVGLPVNHGFNGELSEGQISDFKAGKLNIVEWIYENAKKDILFFSGRKADKEKGIEEVKPAKDV